MHKVSFHNIFVCLFPDDPFWAHGERKTVQRINPSLFLLHISLFCYLKKSLYFFYKRTSWTWVISRHWFFFFFLLIQDNCAFFFSPIGFTKSSFLNCRTNSVKKKQTHFLTYRMFFWVRVNTHSTLRHIYLDF